MMLRTTLSGLRGQWARLVATMLAVVFGVAFVAGALIFGDTARAGYVETFARIATNVDVVVQPVGDGTAALTAAQLAAVRALPDVAAAEGRMAAPLVLLDRRGQPVTNFGEVGWGVSTDGDGRLQPYAIAGRQPGIGEALLDTDTAERLGYEVGDTIIVVDPSGRRHRLDLVGLIDFGVSGPYAGLRWSGCPRPPWWPSRAARTSVRSLSGPATARTTVAGEVDDVAVFATTAPGVSPNAAAALDALAVRYPLVSVGGLASLRSDLESTVDSLLALVAGLLLITIVIALFGVANTMSLSVVERTRESATVRALGLTRGQLRATLLVEAVLMAVVGSLVGLGFGLAYGALLVNRILGALAIVAVPWAWFGGIVALVTITAVLAALLPARRAVRSAIVAEMVDT